MATIDVAHRGENHRCVHPLIANSPLGKRQEKKGPDPFSVGLGKLGRGGDFGLVSLLETQAAAGRSCVLWESSLYGQR